MERGGKEDGSWKTEMEKEGASFMASAKEAWLNIRARIIGQIQKAKAKNEKEASEADLQTAKMQVQAADEAEEKKKQLN